MSDQKVALVTGGNSGFGRLIALALADRGYVVFAGFRGSRGGFGRQAHELETRAGLGAPVRSVQLDVTDDESVAQALRQVVEAAGPIRLLVNSAGVGLLGPLECTTVDQARRIYETNVFGTMRMVRGVVPIMRGAGGGTILNFGSDVGVRANFFQGVYAASKFAVEGMSQAMRWELQQFGIRVAVVAPGWYDTAFGESLVTTFDSGDAAPAYAPLVRAWNDGVNAVEGANPEPHQVADRVLAALEQDALPFRLPVGWNPVRMATVTEGDIDRYEQGLFDYYGLDAFRGPWAQAHRDRSLPDA